MFGTARQLTKAEQEQAAKRTAVAARAALELQVGRTVAGYVQEFTLYCWALNADGSNDANARAVAAALVTEYEITTRRRGVWFVSAASA